jgi:hypothetical protein
MTRFCHLVQSRWIIITGIHANVILFTPIASFTMVISGNAESWEGIAGNRCPYTW